ncbi:MAG: hypothetical protein RBU27_03725, partial [Bacteroidota bacterium]|nr:hypothetical protein [Bacteroidota bacterium]
MSPNVHACSVVRVQSFIRSRLEDGDARMSTRLSPRHAHPSDRKQDRKILLLPSPDFTSRHLTIPVFSSIFYGIRIPNIPAVAQYGIRTSFSILLAFLWIARHIRSKRLLAFGLQISPWNFV